MSESGCPGLKDVQDELHPDSDNKMLLSKNEYCMTICSLAQLNIKPLSKPLPYQGRGFDSQGKRI